MMSKRIEYLFFNIYNWYYQMSLYRPAIKPGPQTIFLLSLSAGCWIFLPYFLCDRLILHFALPEKIMVPIMFIICVLLYVWFSSLFIDNYKYLEIYNKYKVNAENTVKRKRDRLISFILVILPFLLLILCGFFIF